MKSPTLNLLSVDWDYFFPCIDGYDWGHGETRSIYFEYIWTMRAYGHKMVDFGKQGAPIALDTVRVNQERLNTFIDFLCDMDDSALLKLYVCESHASIWDMMEWIREQIKGVCFDVWNLDAHHDYYYGMRPGPDDEPDCATWAYHGKQKGLIEHYHLIYPEWRKESPEPSVGDEVSSRVDTLSYGLRDASLPKTIDLMFICRSSAWTPAWEDGHWMRLLNQIIIALPRSWRQKAYVDYVLKPRNFEAEQAKGFFLQTQTALAENQHRKSIDFPS